MRLAPISACTLIPAVVEDANRPITVEAKGVVLQRFPAANRKEAVLPSGIELVGAILTHTRKCCYWRSICPTTCLLKLKLKNHPSIV